MFNKKAKDRWENTYIKEYNVHYSRIIASWINAGGKEFGREFKEWLRSLEILTEDQIADIWMLASNGKLEWEDSAKKFLSK